MVQSHAQERATSCVRVTFRLVSYIKLATVQIDRGGMIHDYSYLASYLGHDVFDPEEAKN